MDINSKEREGERETAIMCLLMEVHNTYEVSCEKSEFNQIKTLDLTTNLQGTQVS